VIAEEDEQAGTVTRQITSFRRIGTLYRRDHEVHRLHLFRPATILAQLRDVGFRVRALRSYGSLKLHRGVVGFLARKPTERKAAPAER
jgi:hypothetical protein